MTSTPTIRPVDKSDLLHLSELWNENVAFDKMTEPLLHEKTFGDTDFQAGMTLVAEVNQQVAGFMQGLHRINHEGEKVGWIKLFFTVEKFRRLGIASRLLANVENQLKSAGVSRIQILDSNPNYFQPGIDPFYTEAVAFVERRGYEKVGDTSNLIADLRQEFSTAAEEELLASQGIEIRRAKKEDQKEVDDFIAKDWLAWVPEVAAAYSNEPISLHLAFLHGKVRAFSAYDLNNKNTGWFGPMGTDQVFRGKGVGGILLKRCLQDMKNQGHTTSIIPWVGPIPFYMHYVGARVHRVFWRYKKEIE